MPPLARWLESLRSVDEWTVHLQAGRHKPLCIPEVLRTDWAQRHWKTSLQRLSAATSPPAAAPTSIREEPEAPVLEQLAPRTWLREDVASVGNRGSAGSSWPVAARTGKAGWCRPTLRLIVSPSRFSLPPGRTGWAVSRWNVLVCGSSVTLHVEPDVRRGGKPGDPEDVDLVRARVPRHEANPARRRRALDPASDRHELASRYSSSAGCPGRSGQSFARET